MRFFLLFCVLTVTAAADPMPPRCQFEALSAEQRSRLPGGRNNSKNLAEDPTPTQPNPSLEKAIQAFERMALKDLQNR